MRIRCVRPYVKASTVTYLHARYVMNKEWKAAFAAWKAANPNRENDDEWDDLTYIAKCRWMRAAEAAHKVLTSTPAEEMARMLFVAADWAVSKSFDVLSETQQAGYMRMAEFAISCGADLAKRQQPATSSDDDKDD